MRVRRQFFSSLFACFLFSFAMLCLSSAPAAWAQSTSPALLRGR